MYALPTWNRRMMLHMRPRTARGFPSTMSKPLMPTSFTLKIIVKLVLVVCGTILYEGEILNQDRNIIYPPTLPYIAF